MLVLLLLESISYSTGYGHISPKTFYGQMFCIFYNLIGVPLLLVFLANIGDVLANAFRYVYRYDVALRALHVYRTTVRTIICTVKLEMDGLFYILSYSLRRYLQQRRRLKLQVNPLSTVIVFSQTFAFIVQLFPIRLTTHSRVAHRYLGTPSLLNKN